jgi:hypothetical protein
MQSEITECRPMEQSNLIQSDLEIQSKGFGTETRTK